ACRRAPAGRARPARRVRPPARDGRLRPRRPPRARAAPVPRVPQAARRGARARAVGGDRRAGAPGPRRRGGLTAPASLYGDEPIEQPELVVAALEAARFIHLKTGCPRAAR